MLKATLHRKPASSRGISVVEILIASTIAGMTIALIAGLCKPMLAAQHSEAASLAEIQVIDSTLYRLQRDVRQSDPNGIFVCSNQGNAVACNLASNLTVPTDAPALAILTAQVGGTGPTRWDATGRPSWCGFNVYWLTADGHGTNTLYFGFGSANVNVGADPSLLNADAAAAVTQAMAATDALTVAHDVLSLQSMVDITRDRVALRLVGQTSSGGSTNELSVQGDAYARN
jgi:hypothetical protein